MHLGTLNLWYKAASYKPKFIVPQMHFMIHPQDSLAFGTRTRARRRAGAAARDLARRRGRDHDLLCVRRYARLHLRVKIELESVQ